MPKYLLRATYTADGIKGLMKDGGTKRQAAARRLVESLGGKVEAFYYAFGENDVVAIVDMPDNVSAAAASLSRGGRSEREEDALVAQPFESLRGKLVDPRRTAW